MASEVAALHHLLLRQEPREGPDGGRLAGAFLAADQNAADGRIDGVEHQRHLHLVLSDDRGEGVGVAVYGHA